MIDILCPSSLPLFASFSLKKSDTIIQMIPLFEFENHGREKMSMQKFFTFF